MPITTAKQRLVVTWSHCPLEETDCCLEYMIHCRVCGVRSLAKQRLRGEIRNRQVVAKAIEIHAGNICKGETLLIKPFEKRQEPLPVSSNRLGRSRARMHISKQIACWFWERNAVLANCAKVYPIWHPHPFKCNSHC